MIVRILLLFIALFTFGAQAQAIKESYAFAVLGEPRYAFNFNHFDYVNPAAPKGGQDVYKRQHQHVVKKGLAALSLPEHQRWRRSLNSGQGHQACGWIFDADTVFDTCLLYTSRCV